MVIESEHQSEALLHLPPEALRLESDIVELFYKLGLRQIKDFIGMQRSALRRRFGQQVIKKNKPGNRIGRGDHSPRSSC